MRLPRRWTLCCILGMALGGIHAQQPQPVAPPPNPSEEEPSRDDTIKFIGEKLGALGQIFYAGYVHDNSSGDEITSRYSARVTNVTADAAHGSVDFHWKEWRDGKILADHDARIQFKEVEKILVMPREQDIHEKMAAAGHPDRSARVEPPIFVLKVAMLRGVRHDFYFTDEEMADRVAKAMAQAVELCGGGGKEPF